MSEVNLMEIKGNMFDVKQSIDEIKEMLRTDPIGLGLVKLLIQIRNILAIIFLLIFIALLVKLF